MVIRICFNGTVLSARDLWFKRTKGMFPQIFISLPRDGWPGRYQGGEVVCGVSVSIQYLTMIGSIFAEYPQQSKPGNGISEITWYIWRKPVGCLKDLQKAYQKLK